MCIHQSMKNKSCDGAKLEYSLEYSSNTFSSATHLGWQSPGFSCH